MSLIVCLVLLSRCTISAEERAAFRKLQSPDPRAGESICHLHGAPTVESVVREKAGMCVQPPRSWIPYMKARVHAFPNSYWDVNSCSCEGPDGLAFVRVCPLCRAAERKWRAAHGMPSVEEYPLAIADQSAGG